MRLFDQSAILLKYKPSRATNSKSADAKSKLTAVVSRRKKKKKNINVFTVPSATVGAQPTKGDNETRLLRFTVPFSLLSPLSFTFILTFCPFLFNPKPDVFAYSNGRLNAFVSAVVMA